MAGDAAAHRQHGLRRMHAANILGRGFAPDQHARLAARGTGLRLGRRQHDAAGGGTRTGTNAAHDQIAGCGRIDLTMQHFRQRAGRNTHHRLLARDHAVAGQGHGDLHRGAARSLDPHRIEDVQNVVFQREFDLHFLAQPNAPDLSVAQQRGEGVGTDILERRPTRIPGQEDGAVPIAQRVAPLALAEIAAGDLRLAGGGIDELDHARPAFVVPDAKGQRLHDKAEAGIDGCALRLAQQARAGAVPGPRHRPQHLGQLHGDVLREGLVRLELIGFKRDAQRIAALHLGEIERIGVQSRDMDGVGLHETNIKRRRGLRAHAGRKRGVGGIVHADIQDRPRPAPVRVLAGRAHRQQRIGAEGFEQGGHVRQFALGAAQDGIEGQRQRGRHGHAKPDQALQAFGTPAVHRRRHGRRRRDQRHVLVGLLLLHRGDPSFSCSIINLTAPCKAKVTGRDQGRGVSPRSGSDPRRRGRSA